MDNKIKHALLYYSIILQHLITASYYSIILQHHITAPYYSILLQHLITASYYSILLQHHITAPYYSIWIRDVFWLGAPRDIAERARGPSGVAAFMPPHSKTPYITPRMDFYSRNGVVWGRRGPQLEFSLCWDPIAKPISNPAAAHLESGWCVQVILIHRLYVQADMLQHGTFRSVTMPLVTIHAGRHVATRYLPLSYHALSYHTCRPTCCNTVPSA